MNDSLYTVAQTLIEFGADVNAYREGPYAGTPLHHAAGKGLDTTVKLLLSHGANTSVTNDNYHTPLRVARLNRYTDVVRTIENHISYFSGWLREIYDPRFNLSREIWGVVIPLGSNNPATPPKLQLVMYHNSQDSWPYRVISLWQAHIERPNFDQSDPTLMICYNLTTTQCKLASAMKGDKQQIQSLYDACRGISKGSPWPLFHDAETAAATQTDAETSDAATPLLFYDSETSDATQTDAETSDAATPPLFYDSETSDAETQTDAEISDAETSDAATQTDAEAIELATAISASIHSTAEHRPPPLPNMHHFSDDWEDIFGSASHNGCGSSRRPAHLEASSSGWTLDVPGSGASSNPTQHPQTQGRIPYIFQSSNRIPASRSSDPSAPIPVEDDLDENLIYYPPIQSPVGLSVPAVEDGVSKASDEDNGRSSSLCVICWEAPAECACVPCGHVAGCMDCLKEIKANKGACPICRSKIDQVLKIYVV